MIDERLDWIAEDNEFTREMWAKIASDRQKARDAAHNQTENEE